MALFCFNTHKTSPFNLKGVHYVESYGVSAERKAEIVEAATKISDIPKPTDLKLKKTVVGSDGAKGLVEFIANKLGNAFPGDANIAKRLKMLSWIHMEHETNGRANKLYTNDQVALDDGIVKVYRDGTAAPAFEVSLYPWELRTEEIAVAAAEIDPARVDEPAPAVKVPTTVPTTPTQTVQAVAQAAPSTSMAATNNAPPQAPSQQALAIPADAGEAPALSAIQMLEAFDKNEKYKLPAEFKKWKDFDYTREFRDLDLGMQALEDLDVLTKLRGHGGSMDLWNDMRKKRLDPNTISLAEITGAVLGKTLQGLRNAYNAEKTPASEKARYEQFMLAAVDLVEILESNALNHTAETEDANTLELTHEQETAKQVLETLFPSSIRGPKFRGKKEDYVTMEGFKGKVNGEMDYSPAAAFDYLYNSLFSYNEKGELLFGPAEQKAFAEHLNALMKKGLIEIATKKSTGEFAQYTAEASTEITWSGLSTLSGRAKAVELIRAGMQTEYVEKYAEQKMNLNTQVDSLVGNISPTFELTEEEKELVQREIKQALVLGAGALIDGDKSGLGMSIAIPLDKKGILKVVGGFTMGELGEPILHQSFSLFTGLSETVPLKKDSGSISFHQGVSGGPLGVGVGAGLDLHAKAKGDWGFDFGAGVGAGLNLKTLGASIYVSLGASRDMDRVLQRKTEKLAEKQNPNIQEALQVLKTQVTPQVYAAMERDLHNMVSRKLGAEALKNMSDVEFLGFRVGVALQLPLGGLPIPMIGFGLAFKGREYSLYSSPDGSVDLSQLDDAQVRNGLGLTAETTLVPVEGTQSNFTGIEEKGMQGLFAQNLKVEEKEAGIFSLEVLAANGSIDIYAAPGIEAFTEDGDIRFRLDNKDTQVSIRRVNTQTPFESFGHFQHVEIFLSNDPAASNEAIKKSSTKRIHMERLFGQESDARIIRNRLGEGSTVYESKAALNTSQPLENSALKADKEAVAAKEAAKEPIKQIHQFAEKRAGIDAANTEKMQEIRTMAAQLMKDKADELNYKKISTEMVAGDIELMVKTEFPDYNWDKNAMIFMLQALLEASLHQIGNDPKKRIEHILGWNTKRLTEILGSPNLAKRITDAYARKFEENADFGRREIVSGSILQTEVGTRDIEGYRSALWSANEESGDLLGAIPLTVDSLTREFGLTEEDSATVIQRLSHRVSPTPSNPADLLSSQIGRELLEVQLVLGDKFFSKEEAILLENLMAKGQGATLTDVEQSLYTKFLGIFTTIRNGGTWGNEAKTIKISLNKDLSHQFIGFYEKCNNFSTEMKESIMVETTFPIEETPEKPGAPGEPGKEEPGTRTWTSRETTQYGQLTRTLGVTYYGLGMGVAIKVPEKTTTPPPVETPGAKDDTEELTTGPDRGEGGGTGSGEHGASESAPL